MQINLICIYVIFNHIKSRFYRIQTQPIKTQTKKRKIKMETQKYYVTQIKMEEYLTINKTGNVNLCPTYQRPPVKAWCKPPMQNAGLSTIFENLPFPPIHLRIIEGELTDEEAKTGKIEFSKLKLEALDGQQRTLFYLRTRDNEVLPTDEELSPETQCIKGKLFNQWKDEEKAKFLNYRVNVYVYPELSDDQASELFARINSGNIKLTAKQSLRGLILPQLRILQNLINHPALSGFAITDRETILIQVIESMTAEKPDYKDQKALIKRFAGIEITEPMKLNIMNKLDSLKKVITSSGDDDPNKTAIKRMSKRIHTTGLIVSLPAFVNELQVNNVIRFFNESGKEASTNRKTYNQAATQDTASTANILTRKQTLEKIINEPVRQTITEVHKPAPATDASAAKHAADAEYAEAEKAKAKKALDAKIAEERRAKQEAQKDIKELAEQEREESKKSAFLKRKEREEAKRNKNK
jgi:hypothetical protein